MDACKIASTDEEGQKAQQLIERYVKDVEVGETYLGVVKRIMNWRSVGNPSGKEGLVHISQLENRRVKRVEDVLKVGDEVLVKVLEIDRQGELTSPAKKPLPKRRNSKGNIEIS